MNSSAEAANKNIRNPYFWEALLSFGFLIAVLAISIMVFEVSIHLPMILGVAFAGLISLRMGYKFKDLEKAMAEAFLLPCRPYLF